MSPAPFLRTAVPAAVAALTLAACGSAASQGSASTTPTTTAAASSSAPSTTAPDPRAFFDDLEAAMTEARTARISADGTLMSGKGVIDLGAGALRMTATVEGDELTMLVVDGSGWFREPGADTWQALPDGVIDVDVFSPESSLDQWRAAVVSLEEVGAEPVGGAPHTRYALTIDAAKAAAARGEELPDGTPETFDYDVWVDDANHLRRVSFELGTMKQRFDYTRWGDPVDISAPDPDKVVG